MTNHLPKTKGPRYFSATAPTGTTTTTTSSSTDPWIRTQAPDSVLDYTLDWTFWLQGTGDSIAAATFTPSDPAISVVSVNTTGSQATGWLTGGVISETYSITVHITTKYGRQDDRTFLLTIAKT